MEAIIVKQKQNAFKNQNLNQRGKIAAKERDGTIWLFFYWESGEFFRVRELRLGYLSIYTPLLCLVGLSL
jgi:hypothetical protein